MSTRGNDFGQDYSIMCDLPSEILSRIFAMLRIEDRKSVRLVCRSWYHFSTCWSITKNEKFLFRVDSSIEEIVGVMLKSNFSLSNLEFQGLPVVKLPEHFWKVCGPRIHTLKFFECVGDDETIKNIIIYCEHLKSFIFRNGTRNDDGLCREIARLPEFLDELVEKGIQRTKLCHFEIVTHYSHLRGMDLSKIFLVYPCMRHFTAYRGIFCDSFIGFPNSLECLTFFDEFFSMGGMEVCNAKVKQAGLRLRRFEGSLDISDLPIETLFNFFSSQENLNVVNLELNYPSGDCSNLPALSKITFHVLESCPNLRELLIVEDQVYFTWEEFIRFLAVIMKLQYLRIEINLFNNPCKSLYKTFKSLQFTENFALTTLELEISHVLENQDHIYAVLLPHCSSLLHLKLRVHKDYLLQIIFQYLLKLQTLILTIPYIEGSVDYGFTGRYDASREEQTGYSINRLKQLKHLDIISLRCMTRYIGRILLEFQFPLLEVLQFDIELEMLPEEVLNRFPLQVPELRDLIFLDHSRTACTEKIIQFCRNFKKLHNLCICPENVESYDLRNRVGERIEEIFRLCPNLRYVTDFSSILFSFNPITKKVRETKLMKPFKYRRSIFEKHPFAYL